MRLFSVIIYTYFYSNSATVFFWNLRWMPSGPNDLLTFNFLSSSILHTHTNIYREKEKFFWTICQRGHCTFTLWNSPTPNLFIILSSKDQGKEYLEKHLQHSYLLWLLLNILRDLLISVASCSWYTSALAYYFPLPIQIFPILIAPDERPSKTYLPINSTLYHEFTNRA